MIDLFEMGTGQQQRDKLSGLAANVVEEKKLLQKKTFGE